MENGHLNLRKHENEGVPEGVLRKIVETFPGPWGAAYMQDGVMEIFGGDKPSYEELQNFQTEALGRHVFFGFSKEGPQPPYDIIIAEAVSTDTTGKEENITIPVVTAFMAGDFKGKSLDEVGQYLSKKLQKVYTFNEEDIDKFCLELKDEDFKMEIADRIGDRGTIELFCENGEVHSFSKGLTPGSFQWGYMSDDLGLTKKVETKVEEPAPAAASGTRRVVRKPTGSVPAVAATVADKPIKTDTAVPGDAHTKGQVHNKTNVETLVRWKPNPKWSETQLKDKYKKLAFKLEDLAGWKEGPEVYVELSRIKNLKNELGGLCYNDVPDTAVRGLVPTTDERKGSGEMLKDTSAARVHVADTRPVVTADRLPLLSPDERAKIIGGDFVKTLDKYSEKIEDPEKWLTGQKNHVQLHEQLGLPNDLVYRLKYDGVVQFAEKHGIKPLAILFVDARIKAVEQTNLVKQLTEKVHELEAKLAPAEPVKATGTETAAPATSSAQPVRRRVVK